MSGPRRGRRGAGGSLHGQSAVWRRVERSVQSVSMICWRHCTYTHTVAVGEHPPWTVQCSAAALGWLSRPAPSATEPERNKRSGGGGGGSSQAAQCREQCTIMDATGRHTSRSGMGRRRTRKRKKEKKPTSDRPQRRSHADHFFRSRLKTKPEYDGCIK